MPDHRPSPDALLASAQREHRTGGRLKIFLGAAPGVGKTYTMLEAARLRAINGGDVVVGIVETHKRIETAELLLGLEMIPRRHVEYNGRRLDEMDLDAVIARHPRLALVDELAHTNAPGSRHPKRYLDVEELLDAGIDVYTTVNIQHLESLNDAVAQITGVRVKETIPDRIMERADEVELVDVSVEELLDRLREGKVYMQEQAERAIRNYFRPGNLSALRQLSLRHMAERVDEQMHSYMQAHAIPGPWPTSERLIVSVGPSPLSPRLVRATRRMAERRHAEWIAVYVETSRHHRMSEADRERVSRTLDLAEELGGESVTIVGDDVAGELVGYAQKRNATEIVVGKSMRPWWFEILNGSIVRDLVGASGGIDIYVITGSESESHTAPPATRSGHGQSKLKGYLGSLATVAAAGMLAALLRAHLALPNLSMIFLVAVLWSAVAWGLRAAIIASLASLALYDFFFVPPFYTLTIASPQDLLSLVVFLIVAVLTTNLTGRARDQAEAAKRREASTAALYGLSRELAGALGLESVVHVIVASLAESLAAQVVVLLPHDETLAIDAAYPDGTTFEENARGAATWAWRNNRVAGRGSDTLPGEAWEYYPLRGAHGSIGVLAIRYDDRDKISTADERRLIESLSHQATIAIERARLASQSENARLANERERLQSIFLSSISHDLRTPLASILGSATGLLADDTNYDEGTRSELLTTIREEAVRLNKFVGNLLDTIRLESGALRLNRQWTDITDLLGAAAGALAAGLAGRRIEWRIEPGLPLVSVDFVLMTQLFVNLLDNAIKYSTEGSRIAIDVMRRGRQVVVRIEDEGRGIPADDLEKIFDKFYRVQRGDRGVAGTGLGLSICRGIVEEHGGTIRAISPIAPHGGTAIEVTLPIESSSPTVETLEQSA